MRKTVRYKVGDVVNNREVIGYDSGYYTIKCLSCGKVTRQCCSSIERSLCRCKGYRSTKRFSGLSYKNSPEKLAEIKERYKNGVTREMIEEMFNIGGNYGLRNG